MQKRIRDLTEEEIENQGFMLMLHQMGKGDENGITPCKVIHFGKSVNDFLNTEVDIPQPHILDKEEHDYLRAVCKPYKVKYIKKTETGSGNQFIEFLVKSSVYCDLTRSWSMPYFAKDTMYKGMEVDKDYTIEELELDKAWNNGQICH